MMLGCATAVIPGADDVGCNTGYHGIVVQALMGIELTTTIEHKAGLLSSHIIEKFFLPR